MQSEIYVYWEIKKKNLMNDAESTVFSHIMENIIF